SGASQYRPGRARIVHISDREIRAHNGRVGHLCVRIGRQLGMTAAEQRVLARSGLLHDIGKLGIPGSILHKHDPLDDSEWKLMKTHPEVGLKILQWAGNVERALLAVLYHHERMDGTGYPHGLVGDAIPIEARVVAVADMYDVLTSDRPYRRAQNEREARRVLEDAAGPHLDPVVVSALLRSIDEEASRPPLALQ
ncbi:MAG TPA: HD-GYP domain-containing protein, partial [Candidatus Angelobacter sp.]|nr:HD-GYP domain-containing protein [Candidatus Angelobacter sp.]